MYSINSISEIVTVEQLDLIIEFKRPVLLEKVDVLISVDYFILPNLTCNLDTQTPVIILRALSFVSLKTHVFRFAACSYRPSCACLLCYFSKFNGPI